MPMPTPGGTSYPPSTASSYQPPTNTQYPGYPAYSSQQTGYNATQSYPTYSPYPTAQTTSTQSATTVSSQNSTSLSDEQIRASLLSAVEDKMRRRLKEIFAQAQVS